MSDITYIVNNIILPFCASFGEALSVARTRLAKVGIRVSLDDLFLHRRSIDARKRNDIKFVYSVGVSLPEKRHVDKSLLTRSGIVEYTYRKPEIELGTAHQHAPFVVVGAGPCGMFAALMLAEAGFKTILIERGGRVSERKAAIEKFKETRKLDVNTNIQFGAGGAGTFSDGKLVTRINDPLSTYVLERLVEFGAPSEILTLAKPHIGTDILSIVVDNLLLRLESLGAEILYNTTVTDYSEQNGRITSVRTTSGEIPCSALILAIGHSARDTYGTLFSKDLDIEAKDFSVGLRIEHRRKDINRALYGDFAEAPELPSAEYNLSYNTSNRGVYTFCMCPGGEVVAATSEEFGVVVNGMSEHSRSSDNSNAAVCCSIFKQDYGDDPVRAIEFQREIEKRAYACGGGDYSAPFITVGDFLNDRLKELPSLVIPSYMGGSVKLASPDNYLPAFVTKSIKEALLVFDKRIEGYAASHAILTGPETRTSAPLRILRDNASKLANKYLNLYPAGEGAGYAGGITSAAIDGIKCALALMKNYRP